MNKVSQGIEVLLFYINDKNNSIESILPGFKLNRAIKPEKMLSLCVQSISKSMPNAKIILITNYETNIHAGIDNLDIIKTDEISHERLIYDLSSFRRSYIKSKIGLDTNLIFTDIDVLFNSDLTKIFEADFDLATTIDPTSNQNLNDKGLPIESFMFNVTGGIWFVKCNKNALDFFDFYLKKWFNLSQIGKFQNYGEKSKEVKKYFLKWWGELHTLSIIFGRDVLMGKKSKVTINNATILFIKEEDYNYPPSYKIENNEMLLTTPLLFLNERSVIHCRGIRKLLMPIIFDIIFNQSENINS